MRHEMSKPAVGKKCALPPVAADDTATSLAARVATLRARGEAIHPQIFDGEEVSALPSPTAEIPPLKAEMPPRTAEIPCDCTHT